jgi:4-carboxymuconolactone decarboxylase
MGAGVMTTTPIRFAPIPVEEMSEEQKSTADKLINGPRGGIRGPFNALLRNPLLADRVRQLGDSIRFENSLPPALREFTILITARFWSAKYEWHAHSKLAAELGIKQETIDSIGLGEKPKHLTADEGLIYQFCTEILDDKDISDSTYAATLARFGELTVLDILVTTSYFGFVSVILNAIRQPVPEGGIQLPPLKTS